MSGQIGNRKKTCFVIMPFSPTPSCKDWDNIFKNFISPSIKGAGYKYDCLRSEIRGGAFIRDILLQLNSSHVVCADLTDMNPNVFYELGVRHVLKNRSILIAQDMKFIPSDLRGYGAIIYDPSVKGLKNFKKEIRKILKDIEENPERPDSPVDDYLKNRSYLLYEFEKETALRQLMSLFAELFDNKAIAYYNFQEHKNPKWTMSAHQTVCLSHAIINQYVNFDDETFTAMKLLLLKLQQLSQIALEDSISSKTRKNQLRKEYCNRLDVLEKHINTIIPLVQRHMERLQQEEYTFEPPKPVWRSAAWEQVAIDKKKPFLMELDKNLENAKSESQVKSIIIKTMKKFEIEDFEFDEKEILQQVLKHRSSNMANKANSADAKKRAAD